MPEILIKYKKPETLKILKGLAKYLDFQISNGAKKKRPFEDIIIPGDPTVKPEDLSDIFSDRDLDAKKLRAQAWQRKG